MDKNLMTVISAMISQNGVDREYTSTDIANRSGMDETKIRRAMNSGVRNKVLTSTSISINPGHVCVYALTASGKAIAKRMQEGRIAL